MTDEELKEQGIKRDVFDKWQEAMNHLWAIGQIIESGVSKFTIANSGENTILCKYDNDNYEIVANMVNNAYISVRVQKEETELVDIRYTGNYEVLTRCIYSIILNKMLP